MRAEYDLLHQPGGAGFFVRPERALVELAGPDRASFLQGLVSNNVLNLTPGQSVRAALLDSTAHLLALLRVHARPDCFLLETDARCLPRLLDTLDFYHIMEQVQVRDVSGEWACCAVLGDGAGAALDALPPGEGFAAALHKDVPGADLWVQADALPARQSALLTAGAFPLSAETAETLRVEAGEAAWGLELTEGLLLPEADLPDVVSYTKGCYVGQEVIARIHARGHANRVLRGVLLGHDAPVPTGGGTVHVPANNPRVGEEAGREIGRLTSAVASPRFDGRALCLAFVRSEYAANGTPVAVHLPQPDGMVFPFAARVLARPFRAV